MGGPLRPSRRALQEEEKRMQKRMVSLLVALALAISCAPVSLAAWSTNYTLTGSPAQDIVNVALAQNGKTGGDLGYSLPWCSFFVCDCAKYAGASQAIPPSVGTAHTLPSEILKRGGRQVGYSDAQPGDIVAINWNGGTSIGHVEIVYKVEGGLVYTVGGNTGNGVVRVRDKSSAQYTKSRILGVYRPNYTGGGSTPTPPSTGHTTVQSGSTGSEVAALQTLLNETQGADLVVDGNFGPATLAAVKRFQQAYGLTVDGICGPATWQALERAKAVGRTSQPSVSVDGDMVTVSWGYSGSGSHIDVYLVQEPWGWGDIKRSGNTGGSSITFYNVLPGDYCAFTIARPNADHVQSEWTGFHVAGPHTDHTPGDYLRAGAEHPHYNYYACAVCGAEYTDGSTTPVNTCLECHWEHSPGDYLRTGAEHPHYNYYACAVCGAEYTDGSTTPVNTCLECHWEHSPGDYLRTGAEHPHYNYYACAVCGAECTDGSTTPVNTCLECHWRHTWDEGTDTILPTCTTPGSRTFVCAICLLETTESTPPLGFTDLLDGAYYCNAVAWAFLQGITTGTGDGSTFSPDMACTRAQIVSFLWRADRKPGVPSGSSFVDVPPGSYYKMAVDWAVATGVTSGTGDGSTFSPDAACTRSQAMAFLWRAAGRPVVPSSNPFTDVPPGSYYEEAVNWAVATGVTSGTGDGSTFSPDAACTRAQIVSFLYRKAG